MFFMFNRKSAVGATYDFLLGHMHMEESKLRLSYSILFLNNPLVVIIFFYIQLPPPLPSNIQTVICLINVPSKCTGVLF